jgi:hypothetical protein
MSGKNVFFKLGGGSTLFVDPKTKTKITKDTAVKLERRLYMGSTYMINAKKNGHISEISEKEYEAIINKTPLKEEEGSTKGSEALSDKEVKATEQFKKFKEMSKEKMIAFLEDEYELSNDDMEHYASMKAADLALAITRLELEEADEE